MTLKIYKEEKEFKIERPISKLKEELSKSKIDFNYISILKGNKMILSQAFFETIGECLND